MLRRVLELQRRCCERRSEIVRKFYKPYSFDGVKAVRQVECFALSHVPLLDTPWPPQALQAALLRQDVVAVANVLREQSCVVADEAYGLEALHYSLAWKLRRAKLPRCSARWKRRWP